MVGIESLFLPDSDDENENGGDIKMMDRSDSSASTLEDIKVDLENRRISMLSEFDVMVQEKLCPINELNNGE